MKNVVSKVLMMFVVSFMLFTCSYAEFNTIPKTDSDKAIYTTSETNGSETSDFETMFLEDTGYTVDQVITIAEYKDSTNSSELETYTNVMNLLSSKKYVYASYRQYSGGYQYGYYFVKLTGNVDVGFVSYKLYLCLNPGDLVYFRRKTPTIYKNVFDITSTGYIQLSFPGDRYYHNCKVKNLNSDLTWSEEKGYIFEPTLCNEVVSTPDTPTVDYDLAGLITAITSSDVIKDNRDGREDYFIQPYYTSSDNLYYKIYFYADVVNLACFEFVGRDNRYYYDLDKVSVNGIIAKIFDFFVGDKMNTRCFSAYYNEQDSTYDIYFDGSPLLSDLKNIDSEKNPIIFTTKEIPYFSYTLDSEGNVIAIENTSKNITTSDVTDSEGNVISPSVVEDNTSVSETPWQRLVNIITFIPSKIADAIANKMGFNKVMFILSPLFETIYEIIGVFLACLAFIGRAITFVYTLPTIEASSALFSVDVDTTTKGLAFAGNTWGTHFLSGLDKLKALSWGGASLWSFFEAFVVALVAVIAIKLVRKHYHM